MDEKADIKRFNNIFVTHRDRYIRFAYSYTYNQEAAEDLVTESLMYYWENRHRLEDVKDIPLYILVTLKNKCLDYLQRERTWNNIAENLSPAWKHASRRDYSVTKSRNLSIRLWPNCRKSPGTFLSWADTRGKITKPLPRRQTSRWRASSFISAKHWNYYEKS